MNYFEPSWVCFSAARSGQSVLDLLAYNVCIQKNYTEQWIDEFVISVFAQEYLYLSLNAKDSSESVIVTARG